MRPGISRPKDCYLCKSPDIREDLLHRFPVCYDCAERYQIGTYVPDPRETPKMYPVESNARKDKSEFDDIFSFGPTP